MEAWRKTAMRSALVVLIVLVLSEVSTAQVHDCWNADVGYAMCASASSCRAECQKLGKIDGQCGLGYALWPICKCMAPHCV
nr:uncharacterized protein LOC127338732 [Lolium perenne]